MFLAFLGPPTYVSINSNVNQQKLPFSDPTHPPLCWRNTWMVPYQIHPLHSHILNQNHPPPQVGHNNNTALCLAAPLPTTIYTLLNPAKTVSNQLSFGLVLSPIISLLKNSCSFLFKRLGGEPGRYILPIKMMTDNEILIKGSTLDDFKVWAPPFTLSVDELRCGLPLLHYQFMLLRCGHHSLCTISWHLCLKLQYRNALLFYHFTLWSTEGSPRRAHLGTISLEYTHPSA